MDHLISQLDSTETRKLAAAIEETPETLMGIHLLQRGLCEAFATSVARRPQVVAVRAHEHPDDLLAYGDDAAEIWALLRRLTGWTAVSVSLGIGPALVQLIEQGTGQTTWLCEEPYATLQRPVDTIPDPLVRRQMGGDVVLMEAATESLGMHNWRFGSADALLRDGFAAGAIVDGVLVAVAYTSAIGARHGEVGISTSPTHRGRGFATSAATLVCAEIQAAGLVPVWSTAVDNLASLRVAAKLGFEETSRRVYVNLQQNAGPNCLPKDLSGNASG